MTNYAPVKDVGNGVTRDFVLPWPYLDPSHVEVYVNDDPAEFIWLDDGTIRLNTAPASGTRVLIKRSTPSDVLVEYLTGPLRKDDLNYAYKQPLFVAAEAAAATGRDIQETVEDIVATQIVPGTGLTSTYEEATGKLRLDFVGTPGGGSGNVIGPASAVDGTIALFSGATGRLLRTTSLTPASFAARNGGNTFTGEQFILGYTMFGAYGGTYQGFTIRNNSASASSFGAAFMDFQNDIGTTVANIFAEMLTDGRSEFSFSITPPGSRTTDRRRKVCTMWTGATSSNLVITGSGGFADTEGRIDLVADADNATRASFVSIRHRPSSVNGDWYSAFFYNGNPIGTITQVGTTGVAYNTPSDYRLKGNVAPMTNRLAAVMLLNPVTYTWNSDGSAGQGFIAHELQAVIPDAVTGTKDAEDAAGKPVYQGVDLSRVVPTLVAAIQEQQAQIAALTARIAALEGSDT